MHLPLARSYLPESGPRFLTTHQQHTISYLIPGHAVPSFSLTCCTSASDTRPNSAHVARTSAGLSSTAPGSTPGHAVSVWRSNTAPLAAPRPPLTLLPIPAKAVLEVLNPLLVVLEEEPVVSDEEGQLLVVVALSLRLCDRLREALVALASESSAAMRSTLAPIMSSACTNTAGASCQVSRS